MADHYQLEDGSGNYELEDGTGAYLLEDSAPPGTGAPFYYQWRRRAAVVAFMLLTWGAA